MRRRRTMSDRWTRRIVKGRRIAQRLRIVCAGASKRAGCRTVTAEAGIIRVIGIHIRWIFVRDVADSDGNTVENCDRIGRKNLCAVTAESYVRDEIELTVAARRVKFQRRIGRERATANIEHAVRAEHTNLEHICVNTGIIECNCSVAIDDVKKCAADIIIAAINIDRGGRCIVAPINLNCRIGADGSVAGNVHVDGRHSRRCSRRRCYRSKQKASRPW